MEAWLVENGEFLSGRGRLVSLRKDWLTSNRHARDRRNGKGVKEELGSHGRETEGDKSLTLHLSR